MKRHLRRWGAVWFLGALFVGSWVGQWVSQVTIGGAPAVDFWGSTFENWQSEWAQLLVQAIALLGFNHLWFKAEAEDLERIEAKLDQLLEAQ